MGRRRPRPTRSMKPVFLVLCEGQTEATYLEFLKQTFRSPIKIVSNVTGTCITKALLNKKVQETRLTPYEHIKVFVMYDLDVDTISQKIDECDCCKLLSNPCIEVWYLFHSSDSAKSLSAKQCINALKQSASVWMNYQKNILTDTQRRFLRENYKKAIATAKRLNVGSNPSSTVYLLLEELEKSVR